jgi:hypothetical protein
VTGVPATPINPQQLDTGPLLDHYRDALLKAGRDQANGTKTAGLQQWVDQLESEVSRRMAW